MHLLGDLTARRQYAFRRKDHLLERAKIAQRRGHLAEALIVCHPLAPGTPLPEQPQLRGLIDILPAHAALRPERQIALDPQVPTGGAVVRPRTNP